MKISQKSSKKTINSDLKVIFSEKKEYSKLEELKQFNKEWLKRIEKSQKFDREKGGKVLLPAKDNTSHYLIFTFDENSNWLNFGGDINNQARNLGADLVEIDLENENALKDILKGMLLSDYNFPLYKKHENHQVKEMMISVDLKKSLFDQKLNEALFEVSGISLARDLVNTPGEDMKPEHLVKCAKEIAKNSKGRIKLKVLNREQCKKLGMGAFLAVAQGSTSEPYFIHLTYKPKKKAKNKIALIGKGVTFDSGGLSLKPAEYMTTMKCDMAGSATVLGVFKTLANLDLDKEIHGIVAATENMPSGDAIRPGDVVKASNGKTIEILNTDAEGRLTLADALVYAQKLKVDKIIDLATLTGACVVALGEEIAALYSNNDELQEEIVESAKNTKEEIWPMPMFGNYDKLIDSPIADVKNIASSRYGGSITAALFLKRFVDEKQKWAHIDIAGPAFAEKRMNSYTEYGASGFAVATLLDLLMK